MPIPANAVSVLPSLEAFWLTFVLAALAQKFTGLPKASVKYNENNEKA
jgi:hypothetical protein